MAADNRRDLSEIERAFKFFRPLSGCRISTFAEIDERYVQKHLGHTSADMTGDISGGETVFV